MIDFFFIQAKKVVEHKRKYERRRETKEADAKRERIRKAQEAYAKAQQEENDRRAREQQARAAGGQQFPGFPGILNELFNRFIYL